jgi:hypothetical protein
VGAGNGEYNWTYAGKYWGASDFVEFVTDNLCEKIDKQFGFGDDIGNDFDSDRRFNFSKYKGLFTWNNSSQQWDKTSNNSFLARFPEKENSANNNCEIAITDYTDKSCDIEGSVTWLPTKIKAYFKKDGTQLIDIDATADYTGYGIPKSVSAKLYAKPFNMEANLIQTTSSRYSASISIQDETLAENNLSVECTVNLSRGISNYEDFDDVFNNDEGVNNLSFTIRQEKLALAGTVDIKTLNRYNNPTITEINDCFNVKVQYNNREIGSLRVREINDSKYIYIYYKDDTSENTEIYYDTLISHLEDLFDLN